MTTTTHSTLDRKSLRQPDALTGALQKGMEGVSKRSRGVGIGIALCLAVGAAFAVYQTSKETRSKEGADALFAAVQTTEAELKPLIAAAAPPAPKATDAKKPAPEAEQDSFVRLDVDAKLPNGLAALKKVAQDFEGTPAASEARLKIGDLYYDHATGAESFAKAAPWYEKAVDSAPNDTHKALALISLAAAQESMGDWKKALASLDRAFQTGVVALQGEILLAQARCHELGKETEKARSSYDRILSLFPKSEVARTAEERKARLK